MHKVAHRPRRRVRGPVGSSRTVRLAGLDVSAKTERQVVEDVCAAWAQGRGGSILTANVDILRHVSREAAARRLAETSDLVVADGMPLLWAAALAGAHLPERVTGASLFWSLADAAARKGRSVYILGGPPGASTAAAAALVMRFPSLSIAGTACPPLGFETDEQVMRDLVAHVASSGAGLVLLGLGFPKQERVAAQLRAQLPTAWYLGCGAAVVFAAGAVARAPEWMQDSGLEWLHRLAHDPRRLAGRYLRHDAPFTIALLAAALVARRGISRHLVSGQAEAPAAGGPAL